MKKILNVLIIEDTESDAELIVYRLKKGGYEVVFERVENKEELEAALNKQEWDIIISDYRLPNFDALSALAFLHDAQIEIPFIVVSGTIGEETAVQLMRLGAQDYLKKDNLIRLNSVVERELTEANNRRARKYAEENLLKNEQQLRTILATLPVGVFVFDNKGEIVQANAMTNIIFRVTPQKPISPKELRMYMESTGRWKNNNALVLEEEWAAAKALNKHQTTLGDVIEIQRLDGTCGTVIISAAPLYDTAGNVSGAVKVIQDITQLKQAEQSVAAKDSFLANMSHEIRTPLNSIIGFTDLLEQSPLSNQQQEFVGSVRTAGQNLLAIINDILDFSKIESGKLSIDNHIFDLKKILKEVYNLLNVKALEKKLVYTMDLDTQLPQFVLGDSVRLVQILTNLIGNAIKFTEKGSIIVKAKKINETADCYDLQFSVVDTGIGIPSDKIEAIFERFTQASNETTRKYGGTGLGLSITKSLIEMQNGQLSLKSELGKGSDFSFILNYPKVAAPIVTATPIANLLEKPNLDISILLCEDNILNQRLAQNVLSKLGFHIEIAENGKIGLEKLQEKKFDLVLMDLQMPELDGYDTTVAIRKQLQLDIPIIAMTAHLLSKEKELCIQLGMNDYIAKPFKQDELYHKICNVIIEKKNLDKLLVEEQDTSNVKNIEVNLQYLHNLSDGDSVFEKEILELFMVQMPIDIQQMQKAFEDLEVESVKNIAHKLKASLPIIGVPNLVTDMISIETDAVKNNISANTLHKFQVLSQSLTVCYQRLKKILQTEYQHCIPNRVSSARA